MDSMPLGGVSSNREGPRGFSGRGRAEAAARRRGPGRHGAVVTFCDVRTLHKFFFARWRIVRARLTARRFSQLTIGARCRALSRARFGALGQLSESLYR